MGRSFPPVICFCLAVTLFDLVSADNMYVLKTPGDNQHSKMWLTMESSFIRFKFQGCSDLKVALSRDPQVTSTNTYEIIVGGWTNSQSAIRRELNGANLVTVSTPGILSCDEARPFWIGWQNGNITVGKGNVTGQESFMNYVDPEPYLVVAVSLASGYGGSGNGTYYFYQDESRMAIATTPATFSYNTLWLLQSQKSYVKFGVKACNDAFLALSAQMDHSNFTYEVVIGGYNNTQSDIRPGYYQAPSISASTPGILSCTETRHFWVSYEGGLIEVGYGLELGQRRFLHWKYENPHTVTAIGFSGLDVEDEWEFSHTEDDAMLLRTQSDNPAESNWIDVSGKTLFMFRLKACSFGKIELRSSHENWTSTPAYEIIIGGMDRLRGRRDRPGLTTTGFDTIEIIYLEHTNITISKIFQVNDLLSCDMFRRFWLSWRDQKIEIGRNNPYTNILATVNDPVYNRGLKTLHLGTGDLLHQQEWEFVMTSVLATAVKTSSVSGDSFKSNWVTVRGRQNFVFRVRGCYDARIILASYTKVVDVSSYEIVIGANGNQVSRIGKDGLDGGNVVEASTPNVLHCTETRYFWVSWGGGFFQVGSGPVPGESRFLQLQDLTPYKIRSLSFDADSPTVAVWEFGVATGQSYVVQTPADDFAGRRYFRLATHKQSFAFEVVACKDAIVTLSNGTHSLAEIVIGAEENTKSYIKSLEGQAVHVEKSTIGILNCDSKRAFWIQFLYDFVMFGQGNINEVVILEAYIPSLFTEAVSISTRGVRGIWTFNQQSGKFVETETPNVYAYNFTWITVDDRKAMVFNVKACSDAHIALSSQLGVTYLHTYEIVLGAYGNSMSLIRNATQGNPWVALDTPGIVNCTEMRKFWVGWGSGLIRVGRGGEVGMDQIMHWQDPNPYAVHGLGISSGWGAIASWQFSYIQESTYIAYTSSSTEYTGVKLIVDEKTYLEFRVQACSSATVALYREYHSYLIYEIGIGREGNSVLTIYDAKAGIERKRIAYPDLLSCWVERPFWVSWKDGAVRLGQGLYPHSQLLEWVDEAPQPVNSMTLFNWPDTYYSDGIWEFSSKQVYQLNVLSRNMGYYDTLTLTSSGRPFLVFSVMACSDVTLVMSELLGLTNVRSYKVLISFGPRQDQLEIRKNNARKIHRHISCVLHCTQYREFWISWENGFVRIGYGSEVGTNVHLEWQDSHPLPISGVSVSSLSQTTEWMLRNQEGESYFVTTPHGLTSVHTWLIMQRHYHAFMFDAMSCHEISVILAAELGVVHNRSYEIMFGTEENTRFEIRKAVNGSLQKVYGVAALGYLNCRNYQSFWVSWRDGIISAGYGVPYQLPLITWREEAEEFIQVQGLTLGYHAPDPISWKIRKDQSLGLSVSSLNDNSHTRNWITTRYGRHISFTVRSCGNVAIYLSKHMHRTSGADAYVVELGLKSDNSSAIRGLNDGTKLVSAPTPGILSCSHYRPFWIGWFRNGIEVGHGFDIGYRVFLRWDSGLSHVVRAAGVSNFEGESGNFRLPETQGNYHLVLTRSDDGNFTRVSFKMANREYIYLRIRACYGARIRLDGPGYVVEIGMNSNERIAIRLANETIVKSVESPGILSCRHLRFYWISWFSGVVEMGRDAPLDNVLISWTDPAPVLVTGFALATEIGAEGEWETEQHPDLELTVKTPDQWDRYHLWTGVVGREYITFQVAACQDAHLALSVVPLYPEMYSYQVIIGGWNNTKSAIRDAITYGTETKVEVSTPAILDCMEKRDFWVGWTDMTIQVGTGSEAFQSVFMQWKDEYFHEVDAVGFSTGHGATGEWTLKTADQLATDPVTQITSPIPTQPAVVYDDSMYVLKTPGDNQHSKMWLTTESSFIRFMFQGCSDLKVALSRDPQVTDSNIYEIIVGGWSNSQSVIRRGLNGENLVTVSTPGILSCDEARPFWIGWQNGNITVGKGNVTGQESFMAYVDPEPYVVVAVSLASGYDGSGNGTYYLYQDETRMAIATTPATFSYNTLWLLQSQKTYVKFGVKACNDALLALSAQMDSSTFTYEVVIGGYNNTQSDIRPGFSQTPSISASTPGILSCTETRYFWVSYEGGFIEVGQGLDLGQRRILDWKYENPHTVTAIGFSGWDAEDEWEFSHTEDGAMLLRTQSDNPAESNWIDIQGKTVFAFRLKACSFGKIELRSSHENWTSTPAYEIIIGGMQKRYGGQDRPDLTTAGFDTIEIIYLDYSNATVSAIVEVYDLLSCDVFRRFWLSWRDQTIEIGRNNPYTNTLATVYDPVWGRVLKTLHLGTGDLLHQQEWEFVMSTATAVKTSSVSGDSFKSSWVTVRDKQSFVFRVRGCYDARIILASYTKVVDVSSYEIVIGANGNQVSRIGKDGLDGSNIVEASTPNVLHCTETRYFWVSWGGGFFQVGSGPVPGESGFLQLQDSTPYKVRSLSFDADSPTVAIWEFGVDAGQSYVVQTPADDFAGRRYFRLATHKQSFAFEVVACKDAIVTLSNGTHYLAEVVIGAEENTKCIVRSLEGEPIHAEKGTVGILNCDSKREFWIQYAYEYVYLGQGSIFDGLLLEVYIPYLLVEALSISTKGVRGIWTLNQQSGKFVETETPNVYGYNYTWITVDDRKAMVFNVKACSDAHIALSSQLGITYLHTYEIVLGAYGNSMSLIRNATQGNPWVALDTPGIVNCTEMRKFWVGWGSGLIRVGRGGEVGMDQIMHWQDPNPYAVHGLGISSGWGAIATWQFSYIQESTYIAYTNPWSDNAGVNLIVDEKTYFEFRVQACSGAILALYSNYWGWYNYEIGIGLEDNSMLMIYDDKIYTVVREIVYPDLLSCWVERQFWVSWKDGVVRIGQGLYPHSQLLEYVDPAPQAVDSISLFSAYDEYNSDGVWEFPAKQVYQLNMLGQSYGYFDTMTMTSNGRPFLVFSVMACSDVTLVMSEILGLTNVRSYKVLIGHGPGQDQLEIHKDNVRQIHRHLSCVLHCTQFREFWISWEHGFVRIGYGSEVGANAYLEWQDPRPLPIISSVAVSSYSDTTEWQLRAQEGESYFVTTPHGLTEVFTWLIMQRHYHAFMFDAMSCHEISVILAGELGVIHHKAYEIMFGAEENSLVEIRKPVSGSFQRVYAVYAIGHINCNNYQPFWVSWRDGVISAGYGVLFQYTLIEWTEQEEEFIQVQGLTLGYRAPDLISWKIRKDQSLQLLVSSLKDGSPLSNWITTRYSPHISFAVRSCGNVAIHLSKHMHRTAGTDAYVVELGLKTDSYSYIRELKDGTILTSAHTPGILSCSLYRPFWIGWRGNGIEVGYGGDIGYSVFLHWNSGMSHTIRAVGVSTFGGESGNFRLPETQGNYHLVLTRSDDGNFTRVSFKMANREYIYLRIRACYGARIRLDGPGYVVEIGMNDNERIAIRLANETIVKSVESPGILSCRHLRFYWISWFSGVVEMGRDAPLENVLISWTDPAPMSVTGFSLASEIGAEGEWQTEQHPELELTVKTPDQWDRYHLWTSVVGRDYTTFQVAACHDAHLALSFIPLYPEMHSYQVIIGGWDNTKSAIRDEIQDGTTTKVEVSTPAILDCTVKRDFWVGWTNMTIQVGTGAVPFQYGFMQWRDDYFYEVDAVGFSTGHGATGEWTLKTADQLSTPTGGPVTQSSSPIPTQPVEDLSEDNMYTIYTNSTNAFDHFVLTTDQKAFLFTVNACRDVYLFLTHLPGVTDFEAYRITLGVDENTRSSIYKTLPNETTFDASTNIFTCNTQALWVTWADGTISVGEGSDVNQGQLFTWTDTQPYAVNALAMASRDVNTVTWTFRRESGRVLNASTELHYSYNQIWFSTFSMDSAVVNIRACHDAHILLSEANGMSPNTYEVAFGINGNTQSVMREGPYDANIVWVDTPGILSCDELRYFWFRWKDQRLEVGTGSTVGKNFLMEHAKPNHPETIKSIAVSTGWEATGRWEISNVQGQAYTLYTYPSTTQYENWFYTVGKSFTFQLQECQTARVILAESPLHPSTPGLVVTLGVVSSISRLPDTAPLTSVDTPQLLHCYSLRTFWITWTDGIKVGRGRVNYNQFMEHTETSPPVVLAVVLQSPSPSTGAQWQIFRSTVGNSVFTTPSSGTVRYLNIWHSMAEQRYVIFKVRACADARILLADYFAISDYHVYELWLGKNNNTYSVLTDGIDGSLMDETSSHGILHCRTAMWFWIDWTKGLGIGKGPKVGDQLFLNISPGTLPRPLRITSVSYDTGPNHVGEWEFSSVPPQYFTVQTPGVYSHNHTWLIVHSVVITFKVRACEEARILLTESPYNLAVYSREVIIGGWNNTRSAIVKYGDNSTLTERETRTILQCSELQDFWIGWNKENGGRISVGKGVLGSGEFLTHMDPDFSHIYGVSVSTGNGYTGEWQFPTTIARVFEFKTTTTYAYDQFYLHLANQSSATFMVQTCNDAHVGLFDYFLAEKAYEIVIGGNSNQQSFIRRTRLQENQVVVNTTSIVHCQHMLPFWVSWFSGHIKVGRGNIVDEQLFMDWLDPEPLTVTFFSITTGWNATGLWQFSNVEANAVIVNTPNNEAYSDHWLSFKQSQKFLNFAIHSCRSARLFLSHTPFSPPLYEVRIGHDSNTKSQIIRYTMNESGINQGTVVADELSQGILDCSQPRPFWLSWQGSKIEVAMESSSGQRFLDWMDSDPQHVSAVSMATGPESRGEWKYSVKEVSAIEHVTTEEDDRYGFFLLSLAEKSEVTFSVTACKEAHVILTQIPGIFKYRSYELLIGTLENTETWLVRSDDGAFLGWAITLGILNCQLRRFFWISWTINSLSFGRGTIPGQNRILYHNDYYPGHTLNSLSVRTPAGVRGVWGFAGISGDVYELHTPDDGSNHKYSYNAITTWQEVLTFVVKACNDAHVALQSVPGSSEDKLFEIVIGGYINSRSEIRDGKSGPILSFHDEFGILSCTEYRPFWIRWRGGLIEVGKGNLDTHRIMSYQLTGTQNVSITALSTTSGYGSQGDWIVYESDVSSLRVTTLPEKNYNQLSKSITNQNSIVFRVQACRDAHVALSEFFNNVHTRTYEIVIGGNGNTNSFIRDYATGVEKLKVDTPNIMDCNNYRAFWVKWESSGRITVGHGAIFGNSTFLDWMDDEKRMFKGLTISTWDNATGFWDFSFLQGDTYSIFTPPNYSYNYTWLWPMYNYLTFKVMSCKDAHILLSPTAQDLSTNAYEIVIGGSENTISAIRRGSLGQNLVQESTPNIMNCEMLLPFWVRWQNKTLEVGSGPVDSHVLMRLDDPDMPAITVASVTSWYSAWAEYQFLQTEVSLVRVNTTTAQSFWTLHKSTIDVQEVKFKVKSSSDAMLALLSVPSNLNAPSYEVTIGTQGNMLTVLKSKSPMGDLIIQADTPGILDPSVFRSFWISWINGTVNFGSGDTVGQSRLLSFIDPQPTYRKHVHSIAVASGAGSIGEWEFQQLTIEPEGVKGRSSFLKQIATHFNDTVLNARVL